MHIHVCMYAYTCLCVCLYKHMCIYRVGFCLSGCTHPHTGRRTHHVGTRDRAPSTSRRIGAYTFDATETCQARHYQGNVLLMCC
jgi:hypothetical protein